MGTNVQDDISSMVGTVVDDLSPERQARTLQLIKAKTMFEMGTGHNDKFTHTSSSKTVYTCIYTCMYRTYTNTHTHMHTHTHTYTHTQTHTHVYIHIYTYSCLGFIYVFIHKHTRTRIHSHSHPHISTHTQGCLTIFVNIWPFVLQ